MIRGLSLSLMMIREARTHGKFSTWSAKHVACAINPDVAKSCGRIPDCQTKISGESNAHPNQRPRLTAVDFATYSSRWLKHTNAHQRLVGYDWPRVGIKVIYNRIVHSSDP